MHVLAEKNLKHKTDVLAWENIHEEECDLNFRPPDAELLDMSPGATYLRLAFVSLCGTTAGYFIFWLAAPYITSSASFLEALVVGLIIAGLVVSGVYRPLPRPIPSQRGLAVASFAVASVCLFYLALRMGYTHDVFNTGVFALFSLALPWSLFVADQFTGHMVHWMTAHPRIDHQTMVRWREDWRHRFMAPDTASAPRSGQSAEQTSRVQWVLSLRHSYWQGFMLVGGRSGAAALAIMGLAALGRIDRVGMWMPGSTVAALFCVAVVLSNSAPRSFPLFRQALAHWFSYLKDTVKPPWVFQSPAGWHLGRAIEAYVAVLLLAGAWALLGLADFSRASFSLSQGTDLAPIAYLAAGLIAVVTAPLVYLLVLFIVSVRVLSACHQALEGPEAYEQNEQQSALDGYSDRLRHSRNPTEQDSVFLGYTVHHQYPVIVPTELLLEHMHVLGPTGTGKTVLTLIPLVKQLITKDDGSVIVLDGKGDMALFHTVRLECERAGRKFKWFTNKPHRSTYIFNPFRQDYLQRLTLQEIVGLFMLSLNLHHGDDYGRAWFSMSARTLFQHALKRSLGLEDSARRGQRVRPIESFLDLEAEIRDLAASHEEYRSAQHLAFIIQHLSEFEQLNMSPRREPHHPALRHAIHMPEVVREKQVVYFSLAAAMDLTSVSEIARLALYSALSAAIAYRDETGRKPRVYVIGDEAQTLVAQNIANVLAQAREHGLGCILAHQTMSQLNPPGGVDLRELVLNCTSIKQIWSARDPAFKDHISKISGEVGYYSASWDQFKRRVARGEIGRQYAASHPDEPMYIHINEEVGPRLTSQDIEDSSRDPNVSIVAIERNAGFSCFQGAFPVRMEWPMTLQEYRKRNEDMPWPEKTEETIEVETAWPKEKEEAVEAEAQATDNEKGDEPSVADKLDTIHQELSGSK